MPDRDDQGRAVKLANIDHLPWWQITHLARRYDGMATDPRLGTPEQRARWAEIAEACRAHPKHPRST